jgi:hypothetical protein
VRAALALLAWTAVAHAEHEGEFAKVFPKGGDVVEFEIAAGDVTHLLIGRTGTAVGAVLLHCRTSCEARHVEFGTADGIEVAGVFDLEGKPTELPTRAVRKATGSRAMKFPVVAIVVREPGRKKLFLISLLEADRGSIVFMDSIAGTDFTRSYRLDKGDTKDRLDLIAKEKRKGCEAETSYSLEEHHYRTKKATPCGTARP